MRMVRALGANGLDLIAAADASAAQHQRHAAAPTPSAEEALEMAITLARGASESLARCAYLLELVAGDPVRKR